MRKLWRIWAKALGAKEGKNDREADIIACIRTFVLMCYMVTNVAIVANAMRHWNNIDKPSESTLESPVTCPKP
jgi:hypothetical protein